MAVLSLPLSFTNSFWSQDYRKGLEVLYNKLEQGVAENDEIIAFIRARAVAEANAATALIEPLPVGTEGSAFKIDDGATLLMAFHGLQAETVRQGEAHKAISTELHTLVADPFEGWANGYKERIRQSKSVMLDGYLRSYEHSQSDVAKLKSHYLAKVRKADEAEDDAKFAPNSQFNDKYTTSPRLAPSDAGSPKKSASISGRIAQRLKEIQRKTANATASPSDPKEATTSAVPEEQEPLTSPKVDKGKGKAVEEPESITASPPPLSPPLPPAKLHIPPSPVAPKSEPIILAGLSLPPAAVSSLLTRAAAEMPLRPVRFPIIGEYPDCFTGEEFQAWLTSNVEGFGGSLDRAEDAAKELTERDGLLRRIGEFGNQFEATDDAFYQFRPKAFELAKSNLKVPTSPTSLISPARLTPVADNLVKRSNNFFNVVTKALNTSHSNEPPHIRARAEADVADREYRVAVRKLDRQRLGLEERIEEALKTLQKWEGDRLQAVKTVLLQYHGTLSNLPKSLEPSVERSRTFISSFIPESDLTALIERYRTGPFRPHPQLYESVAHDESDVLFGIDLRKWAEGGWSAMRNGEEKKELVPPVLTALLEGLDRSYAKQPSDEEKRRTWIYEVPLPAVHHLREALNAVPPEQPIPADIMEKYDAPVLASTVKLWILELDPPLALWEGWEEIRRLYPAVGAKGDGAALEQEHLDALQTALLRLPKVHLYVLDAVVGHLRKLIDETKVEEADEFYVTKLALSIGRTIVRPKVETEMTIQDRHPAMLFIDLVKYYSQILPPTIVKKKRESERKVPLRKRTAPIDMRISRSKLSQGTDARDWLLAQRAAGHIPPPVPPVPANLSTPTPAPAPAPQPVAPAPEPEHVEPEPPAEAPAPAAEVIASPVTEEPPALPSPPAAPPSPPAAAPTPPPQEPEEPARPNFVEPPPELDEDVPPRPPAFKEPDLGDMSPPPSRPNFPEPAEEKPTSPVVVSPATPSRKGSISSRSASPNVRVRSPLRSPVTADERSASPQIGDEVLNPGRASLSRNASNEARLRGPRGSRPPRAAGGGGSVSNIVNNFNRNSIGSPPSPGRSTSPPTKGRRPVSGIVEERRRNLHQPKGSLSRRTMDSDAEDNIVS
ncbi:hypothetical protein DENSPDRAFT_795101 [Dentipellis sp. KUC8613]|nr:hypothetical protein DENSPDRAFT_795101 [Dentipellis sp. KUC8613]